MRHSALVPGCCAAVISLSWGYGRSEPAGSLGSTTHVQDPFEAVYEAAELQPAPAGRMFTRVPAAESGVRFGNPIDNGHPNSRLYWSGFACGGVALGDFDADGRKDLFFTSGPRPNGMFRQTAPWRFEDVTGVVGVGGGEAWGAGAAAVDIDGDGSLDLYVCNYDSPNQLFHNDGVGRFRDVARETGLDLADASLVSAFADYDRDGDLDVYIALNRLMLENGRPARPPVFMKDGRLVIDPAFEKYLGLILLDPSEPPMVWEVGRSDRLYRNEGPGPGGLPRFADVSQAAGIEDRDHALSCLWTDPNEDGYPDLFVANDYIEADRFYANNHDGTFREVSRAALGHTAWFSMGSDEGDVNNDGLLDIIALDMSATSHYRQKVTMGSMGRFRWIMDHGEPRQMMRNVLHVNSGKGRYLQMEYLAGVASSDWSWTPVLADFDQDGWIDLFITNGVARDFTNSDYDFTDERRVEQAEWEYFQDKPPQPEKNLMYANHGDLRFTDESAAWGLDELSMAYAAAAGDLDSDGDLDLVVASLDRYVSLFRNNAEGQPAAHHLSFRLIGRPPNTGAIGAEIRISHPTGTLVRRVNPHRGFLSSQDADLHFGLGETASVGEATVIWPGGERQRLVDLAIDQLHVVREDATDKMPAPPPVAVPPRFQRYPLPQDLVHQETPFDDFALQPLLPNKYSQLGPCLAWGDIDGDGRDDLFMGGSAGFSGHLLHDRGPTVPPQQRFDAVAASVFEEDAAREDAGAVFVDVEGDGDLDLYIASGSSEFPKHDPLLGDRLYLNDGSGGWARAGGKALPDLTEASSCVAAADADRDGDPDLFVGTRLIPGDWPAPATSYLLINSSRRGAPRFVAASDEVAGPLTGNGLVTGAVWTDLNNDLWPDLVLSREWASLQVLINHEGRLADATKDLGLQQWTGWWNSVCAADLDRDGDMDLVAGNTGLNTKYHATQEHPALLYYGDYDGSGRKQCIEAEFEEEKLFPVRGRSCSSAAMPHLTERFSSYHSFAQSTLQEIYSETTLAASQRFEIATLESAIFWNDGESGFRFEAMPRFAQGSPVFGIAVADTNADGYDDLILAQNFFGPQNETGRYDSGAGVILESRGAGRFEALWPWQSGLLITGAATSITVADLDGDPWPDIVVAQNDGPLAGYTFLPVSLPSDVGPPRRVRLPAGRLAAGTRLLGSAGRGLPPTVLAEYQIGSGYLSQQGAVRWIRSGLQPAKIQWPDGSVEELPASQ